MSSVHGRESLSPRFTFGERSWPLFADNRSSGVPYVRDKSRSLGFSLGAKFSSPLKSPVFFMDGAEQECSGYILSSASFLLGRCLATQSRDAACCLLVAQPFRGLMTTQQRRRLGIVSELVLGGRGMGCSLCRPPRSRLTLMASR